MVFCSAALPLIGFASIAVDGSADVAIDGEGVGRPAAAAAALLPLPLETSIGDAAVLFVVEEGAASFIVGIAWF